MSSNTSVDKVVAYIDIMGFREAFGKLPSGSVTKDQYFRAIQAPAGLVEDYNFSIIQLKSQDKSHPISAYPTSLRAAAEKAAATSFDCVLPFSDSIFIFADSPIPFLHQLSHFLYSCFYLNAQNAADSGAMSSSTDPYPLAFRGGISLGPVTLFQQAQVVAGNASHDRWNAIGHAINEAVGLEIRKSGPRIGCSTKLEESLPQAEKHWIAPLDNDPNRFELLWPITAFDLSESWTQAAPNGFGQFLQLALNLLKRFDSNPDAKNHYAHFVRLVVKSAIVRFPGNDCKIQVEAERVIAQHSFSPNDIWY